jgi:hypothetical protein
VRNRAPAIAEAVLHDEGLGPAQKMPAVGGDHVAQAVAPIVRLDQCR